MTSANGTTCKISALFRSLQTPPPPPLCAGQKLKPLAKFPNFAEPTSGLDTYTAYSVVHTLKTLAHTGRTVVATLHQPSSEIFHMFDDLVLLAAGRVMYMGPANKCVEYFAKKGYQCPQYTNPADYFFMEVLNISNVIINPNDSPISVRASQMAPKTEDDMGDKVVVEQKNQQRAQELLDTWMASNEGQAIAHASANPDITYGIDKSQHKSYAPFTTQFGTLFMRAARNSWRNKMIMKIKIVNNVIISLIAGLIYLQMGYSQASIQNRQGALFFIVIHTFMSSAMPTVSIFYEEKMVFAREYGSRYYGMMPYFTSKLLVEYPINMLSAFIGCVITYWMFELQANFAKFLIYCVSFILLTLCGVTTGVWAAAAFPHLQAAMAALPTIIVPLMVFSGFYIQSDSIPVYFSWIQWIDPLKYPFQAVIINEFDGLTFTCDTNSTRCITDGQYVIDSLGFDNMGIGACIGILLAILCVLVAMSAAALWMTVCRKR